MHIDLSVLERGIDDTRFVQVNRSTSIRPDALWQYDIATAKAVLEAVRSPCFV